jgi:ABC-type phosphate transport system substrate-binding protein
MCLLSGSNANAADVSVIANASVKVTEVSSNELRDLFLGDKSALEGSKAIPVTLSKGGTHEAFLEQYVGKTDAAFKALWRKQVFTGKGTMPRSFDTEEALVAFVNATPGAVGYVSSSKAGAGVKVLKVK